jgi:hypothetical protein
MNSVDIKIDGMHPFDVSRLGGIGRSTFILFLVSYPIKLADSAASG